MDALQFAKKVERHDLFTQGKSDYPLIYDYSHFSELLEWDRAWREVTHTRIFDYGYHTNSVVALDYSHFTD